MVTVQRALILKYNIEKNLQIWLSKQNTHNYYSYISWVEIWTKLFGSCCDQSMKHRSKWKYETNNDERITGIRKNHMGEETKCFSHQQRRSSYNYEQRQMVKDQ